MKVTLGKQLYMESEDSKISFYRVNTREHLFTLQEGDMEDVMRTLASHIEAHSSYLHKHTYSLSYRWDGEWRNHRC